MFKLVINKVVWLLSQGQLNLSGLREFVNTAIRIVSVIKTLVKDGGDVREAIKAFVVNDDAVDRICNWIVEVIDYLEVGNTCLKKETPEAIIQCFIDYLKKQPKTVRKGVYMQLASGLVNKISGLDISPRRLNALVNLAYTLIEDETQTVEANS